MNRKDFISITLATIAGGLSQKLFGAVPIFRKSKNITVGAHVWLYASTLPEFDVSPVLPQIFSDLKYAGMDGVELMHHPLRSSKTTKQIGELSNEHDLPVIGTSYGANMWDKSKHNEILEDAENIIVNLAAVKGRTLGTTVGNVPGKRLKTEEELDNQASLLKKIIVLAEKNGIVLNLHNHSYEVENNLHDLGGTLKRVPCVKLGPDLNWLLRAEVDPIWFLKKFKDSIVFLHLRDQLDNGKWPESLGEGDVDFKEISQTLTEINFTGDVIIELALEHDFTKTRPIKESFKISREHVRKTMGF